MEDLMDEDEKDRAKRYQPQFVYERPFFLSVCLFLKAQSPFYSSDAYQSFKIDAGSYNLMV